MSRRSLTGLAVLPFLLAAGPQTPPPAVVPPVVAPPAGAVAPAAGGAAKVLAQAASTVVKGAAQGVAKVVDPKAQAEKLIDKVLEPKITEFTLDGFKVVRVEGESGARPEAFSGKGHLMLPAPLQGLDVTFKGLAIAGATATGTIEGTFGSGAAADHQGWRWTPASVKISDKGSRLTATLAAGHLHVAVGTVPFTPAGLSGTLALGEVPLAAGAFTGTLQDAEVVFSQAAPLLKGTLRTALPPALHHAETGAPAEGAVPVAFEATLLAGSGTLAPAALENLPTSGGAFLYQVEKLAFEFDKGVPVLQGTARMGFPLQTFCLASSTGSPWFSQAAPVALRGTVPAAAHRPLAALRAGRETAVARPALDLVHAAAGFSGTFPLPPATLVPSGISAYRLKVDAGSAVLKNGALDPAASRLTGSLAWGEGWKNQVDFKDAPAAMADGLFLTQAQMKGEVPVGAYGVQAQGGVAVIDFSDAQSPAGLPAAWKGVHLPAYLLSLPEELYRFNAAWERTTVFVPGKDGLIEANGGFTGRVAANLPEAVNLHVVPVKLDPFELEFAQGSMLDAPRVTGRMELDQAPALPGLDLPIAFDLAQAGTARIVITTTTPAGDTTLKTDLVGVDMVLASATLNPTNLDLTGRFDFHVSGAGLPSIAFDHLVFEASGGGIEGKNGPVSFAVVGASWSGIQGHPKVNLWGYGFGLQENGFGTLEDGRFFVGFGGEMDINPILSSVYNRVVFTSQKEDRKKGTVEIEKGFDISQSLGGLADLKASLNFHVDAADDQVSDAYFLGKGKVNLAVGDSPYNLDAGFRFGRSYAQADPFPYFFAMGHVQFPNSGIPVAQDVEIYGFAGGLSQNFLPDEIRDTENMTGKADKSLGMAIMAGVDVGTMDQYAFHGGLDLYISQNLTTRLQGEGFLLSNRDQSPPDNRVSADILFSRNPNALHAVLDADLTLYDGLMRFVGTVEMRFDPTQKFVHVGTREAPLTATYLGGIAGGTGYFTADIKDGVSIFATGGSMYMDSGERDFGVVWGRAYLNMWGDLVVIIDADRNPSVTGVLNANGGAAFGMKFKTFWKTYRVTIFSGDIAANMAFKAPGSPTLAGRVVVSYSVLGGLFSGSVGVGLEF